LSEPVSVPVPIALHIAAFSKDATKLAFGMGPDGYKKNLIRQAAAMIFTH
jgi:hypothetical protein